MLSETICRITGAEAVTLGEEIQSLWSGYGVIQRATLCGLERGSGAGETRVVIKHIDISRARSNRRGWGGDISHKRKVRSYAVEKAFYERFSNRCNKNCRAPDLIAAYEKERDGGWILILSDLDFQGFDGRKNQLDPRALRACLTWLANFHATFMESTAEGLWPVGTYWHLETRPEELSAMPEGDLKRAACQIDERLNAAKYQTLVHGDAKVANFCFSQRNPDQVAAVDFQYVGRGCGMKDVAYFISSCLSETEAAAQQNSLLDFYFGQLRQALSDSLFDSRFNIQFEELRREWHELYSFAWADFCRFLSGWSPGHWKLNDYSEKITRAVLEKLARE